MFKGQKLNGFTCHANYGLKRWQSLFVLKLTLTVLLSIVLGMSSSMSQSSEPLQKLFENLKKSKSEEVAKSIEEKIWQQWFIGPDNSATRLLSKAMKRRRAYDFDGALNSLNRLIEHYPDWAEAWNQRAFIYYLKQQFDKSLQDADKALELEPNHFGALAGKAIILIYQGRAELAQQALKQAVKIHPFLKERSLLIEIPGKEL